MNQDPVRDLLVEELERRRLRNPSYSLRAFTRDLGVSLTALSTVLSGQRRLSRKNFEKVSEALLLSPDKRLELLEERGSKKTAPGEDYEVLTEDIFRLIGEWHYYAILNLAKIPGARADVSWLAKRLGLDQETVREALGRLERLGFVQVINKQLKRTTRPITSTRDIPSVAIRKGHLGMLQLAEKAILDVPVEQRYFVSTFTPASRELMEEIKKYMRKASDRIVTMAEKGEVNEVYCISMQYFPLTKKLDESGDDVGEMKPKKTRRKQK